MTGHLEVVFCEVAGQAVVPLGPGGRALCTLGLVEDKTVCV